MMVIWKYDVPSIGRFTLGVPRGARILTCAIQHNRPRIWAMVDPKEPTVSREFLVVGTGEAFDRTDLPASNLLGHIYVGTFQLEGGLYVYHLFDLGES